MLPPEPDAVENPQTTPEGRRTDGLLIVAGVGAVVFILLAGFSVYRNTRNLEAAKNWVAHTQELITVVENASKLTDNVEFNSRLYVLGHTDAELSNAQSSAAELEAVPLKIAPQLADPLARKLNATFADEARTLESAMQLLPKASAIPFERILAVRKTLELLTDRERKLLEERTRDSDRQFAASLLAESIFVGLSLLTIAILFGALVYDARLRRRVAREVAESNRSLTGSVLALKEAARQASLLRNCSDELQLCINAEQIHHAVTSCLSRLLAGTSGSLCIINHSRTLADVVSAWGGSALTEQQSFEPEACCGIRLGHLRWRSPHGSEIHCTHFSGSAPGRYFCVPLLALGETIGVLFVECDDDEAFAVVDQRMKKITQVLQLASMALGSLNLRSRLENQAIRDSLTGIFNRHFMEIALQRDIARVARTQGSLAVLMIDVDQFKRFNDTYGHGAGDTMLRAVAGTFQQNIRTEDTACRYGGEEFAILLPGISVEAAFARAERIRLAVSRLEVPLGEGVVGQTTISAGIALYPGDGVLPQDLLRCADRALYEAKQAGRNTVVLAGMTTAA